MTALQFDFTTWMGPQVAADFAAAVRPRAYPSGATIYGEGDAGAEMYRIRQGTVRLLVTGLDGRHATFLMFGPGDAFGISSLIDDVPRPQTAEAVTAVELDVLDRAAFERLRRGGRDFDTACLKLLSTQMRAVSGFYAGAQLADLRERVERRISDAVRAFGAADAEGVRLSLRLSQSDLASLVGSSRQSVGKVLQTLQAEGLIRIEYGNVLVPDPSRLLASRR